MTLTFAPATVGTPDIAEPADGTLPGPWMLPHRREPAPLTQFAAPGWTIPPSTRTELPSVQVQLRQIKDWTGWSFRTLGTLTGTTHPTIEAVLEGRTRLTRTPDTARRISVLHRLIVRLRVVVHGDPEMLVRILSEPPGDGRPSAVELFTAGDLAAAYLAALDVIRPPRTGGMMRSLFPGRPGEATSALHDQ
jgi:hypothetical protein